MKIHERPSTKIMVGGRFYCMRPTVCNVIRATNALEDRDMLPPDREALAVELLFKRPRPNDRRAALEAVFRAINEPSSYRVRDKGVRSLDYEQDANLIIAAFRQLYGIDLQEQAAHMDWREFRALLSGVTSETQLGQIIEIRTRDLPKRTKHNAEMIREMQRMKAEYAVRPRSVESGGYEDGLKKLALMLADMAGGATSG